MHLGYYIHLHGNGHAQRARTIANYCNLSITFIGTNVSKKNWNGVANYQLLELPSDELKYIPNLPINKNCHTYSFHHAPYYSFRHRQRAMAIAKWVEQTDPTAVIVDVSAEITQYLRFLGVPVIGVRQHGDRTDSPHLCGYSAAYKLLAPFPQQLESLEVPDWIKDKTIYTSGFSRYCNRTIDKSTARAKLQIAPQAKVVLVLNGRGGGKHSLAKIAAAASVTPEWSWLVLGEIDRNYHSLPSNVLVLGWCEDTYIYLKAADVAIASGGHNTVMEIGTAQIPFLCIPEQRPFAEQKVKARILENLDLCLVAEAFPDSNTIDSILKKLIQMDVRQWKQIVAVDGAAQTAKAIQSEVEFLFKQQKLLEQENLYK